MSRKPRSDAKLLNLLPYQQEQIVTWLTEGVGPKADTSYRTVREQIYQEWGLRTSDAALVHFRQRVVGTRLLREASEAANALVDAAADSGLAFEHAALGLLRQKTFEVLADPEGSPKVLEIFYRLMVDSQRVALGRADLALKERRVSLLEEQQAKAKDALNKIISKGGVTPETLKQIEEAAKLL